jgi:hypothetical protein
MLEVDGDSRFDPSRRLPEVSHSPAEQAYRRVDRDLRFAWRSGVLDAARPRRHRRAPRRDFPGY